MSNELNFMTTAEVATLFRTTRATIYYWRHIGYGPRGCKVGRKVLYQRADVEAFLEQSKKRGEDK